MQHRLGDERDDALRGREQIVQIDLQRRRGCIGGRRLVAAPIPLGARIGGMAEPVHQLADLLVLEQPPHQLGPWILPLVLPEPARQQHLRLDAQQPRRHFQVIRRLIEPQLIDDRQELIGDLGDREVGDVDLVLADQMQQQIERAGKLLQLDDER